MEFNQSQVSLTSTDLFLISTEVGLKFLFRLQRVLTNYTAAQCALSHTQTHMPAQRGEHVDLSRQGLLVVQLAWLFFMAH